MAKKRFKKIVVWEEGSISGRLIFLWFVVISCPYFILSLWFPFINNIISRILWTIILIISFVFMFLEIPIAEYGKRKVYYEEV